MIPFYRRLKTKRMERRATACLYLECSSRLSYSGTVRRGGKKGPQSFIYSINMY